MALFKKTKTDAKTENQDIDFLKQSINSVVEDKSSTTGDKLPKLSNILGNKPDAKSKLSDINFEAMSIEERNKGNAPGDKRSEQTDQKPDIGAVRAALESSIKEKNAATATATTAVKPVAQATQVNPSAATATTAAKPVAQATQVNPSAATATT
ncbi:MAG: hypothetical protein M8353_05305, partial [ANME-2 cluster archaeon]|nr:hypothetical protein [ANME-2 cluster archaeon]